MTQHMVEYFCSKYNLLICFLGRVSSFKLLSLTDRDWWRTARLLLVRWLEVKQGLELSTVTLELVLFR